MLDQVMQLQLPHWLIIAGIVLVIVGVLGMLFRRRKDPSSEQSAEDQ
ncbi:LPXTG cell wall anchor domain-containing protein [Bradyrhizobium sp. Ec3.3]|nr:LPXTG cell wall anchor domain-containing protein [Bradyrhizobium sp. Ec3.3]